MRTLRLLLLTWFLPISLAACKKDEITESPEEDPVIMNLKEMAVIMSHLPLEAEHLAEVNDAVCASVSNGYDEEYMMSDLITDPGSGVGSTGTRSPRYSNPIRDLIQDYLSKGISTRSSGMSLDEYMHRITLSGMQVYWPYHDLWDGETLPVITFDPEDEAITNIGYEIVESPDGGRDVREIIVTESMAKERPVWVINSNDDSRYLSSELLERLYHTADRGRTKSSDNVRNLILKEFKMKRQYDNWFRGASEFFVKCGAVSGFSASTEAELKLYQPAITDFMIVVRRSELLVSKTFNTMLISDWTDQLENFAFMITEDDGGTRTSWKTEAIVKMQSKSYGISLELPYNVRDDIVWRGSLSGRYFESYKGEPGHFGDVDVVFDVQ